jgi:ABC-type cobalt transport system substrate-binding protein
MIVVVVMVMLVKVVMMLVVVMVIMVVIVMVVSDVGCGGGCDGHVGCGDDGGVMMVIMVVVMMVVSDVGCSDAIYGGNNAMYGGLMSMVRDDGDIYNKHRDYLNQSFKLLYLFEFIDTKKCSFCIQLWCFNGKIRL